MKPEIKYLGIICAAAILLGLVVIINLEQNADEMVYGSRAINFFASGLLSSVDQVPLFLYLTAIFYKLIGINFLGLRFGSFLFGYILSIPLVYLLGRKLADKKTGVVAAFLFAFSPFYLQHMLGEPDIMMTFFVLLSTLFLLKQEEIKIEDNNLHLYLAFVFMGIAIMIKTLAVLFLIAALIGISIKNKVFLKENKYRILLGFVIIGLLVSPILIYNYLLYHDQGKTDIIFNRFLKLHYADYSSLSGAETGIEFKNIPSGIVTVITFFLKLDPAITLLFLLSIPFLFNRKYLVIYLIFLVNTLFLASTSLLPIHFAPLVPFMVVPAAVMICTLRSREKIYYALAIILIINSFFIYGIIKNDAPLHKLTNYIEEGKMKNSLIIADARIYRGQIAFALSDTHYIEAAYLSYLVTNNSEERAEINSYFIECVSDDCGWGTIAKQPELNNSMEDLVLFFETNGKKETTIFRGNEPAFRIYRAKLDLRQDSLKIADSTDYFYFYPVAWKEPNTWDNYKKEGTGKILHEAGMILTYIIIALSFASLIVLFNLLKEEFKDEAKYSNPHI